MDVVKNIAKAYLQGVWDSVKGVSLIFIVARDTYAQPTHNDQTDNDRLVHANYDNASLQQKADTDETLTTRSNQNARATRSMGGSSRVKREKNKLEEESNLLKRIFQCCLLNGGFFGLSIILFECALLPFIRVFLNWMFGHNPGIGAAVGGWIVTLLSIIFGMIWILPLFVLSKIVNSLWFQDIADSAYKVRKGRPQSLPSFSVIIADTLFSLLVQTLFLVQSMAASVLPINYFGIFCNVHLCLLYSLYSFEYKWFNMGWELHKRLTYIETNWPYFLGFGTILTILTQLSSSYIINGCIFAVFFPFNILSANEATPVTNACDYPLKFFGLVVAISNALFNKTIRPTNPQQSRAPSAAAVTAANANQSFATIRQQTTSSISPAHSRRVASNQSSARRS